MKQLVLQPAPTREAAIASRAVAWLSAAACAVALVVVVLATRPAIEMPFCDDFSYVLSAAGLAKTGHIVYNGWAAPTLGWLLFYGAFVIRFAGFSWVHLHASMLVIAAGCTVLLHRVFARSGMKTADATFATLTLVLSVLFVPLSFSFMTDIPGLFVIVLCLYLCLRSLQARDAATACAWLIAAILSNAVGGTVRQVSYLGLFAMVPATAWSWRHERRVWMPAGVAWVLSLAYVRYFLHWFSRQPYALHEDFRAAVPTVPVGAGNLLHALLLSVLYLLPVAVLFLLPPRAKPRVALAAVLLGGVATLLTNRFAPGWIAPFGMEWLSVQGFWVPSIIGWRPVELSPAVCIALTVVVFATLAAVLYSVAVAVRGADWSAVRVTPVMLLYAASLASAFALTFSRSMMLSRYFLMIWVLLLPALMKLYRRGSPSRVAWSGVAVLAVFTAFTIVSVHDEYAIERARLAGAQELIRHGYSRDRFWAGFEMDGWTQIEKAGTLNDPRLGPPTAVWRPAPQLPGPSFCQSWFASWSPAIHAEAQLAYVPLAECGHQLPGLQPLAYHTWFSPQDRYIYFMPFPAK